VQSQPSKADRAAEPAPTRAAAVGESVGGGAAVVLPGSVAELRGAKDELFTANDALFGPLRGAQAGAAARARTLSERFSADEAERLQNRFAANWVSPFAHGIGSSWHSGDSAFYLWFFCQLDWLFVIAVGVALFLHTRSYSSAAAIAGVLGVCLWVQGALELNLLELLICRPWIWLIMT